MHGTAPLTIRRCYRFALAIVLVTVVGNQLAEPSCAQHAPASVAGAKRLLADEPFSLITWPQWKTRLLAGDYNRALSEYRQARRDAPDDEQVAMGLAQAMTAAATHEKNREFAAARAEELTRVVEKFPTNGRMRCLLAILHAMAGDFRAAVKQLDIARGLGFDVDRFVGAKPVAEIRQRAQPGIIETVMWIAIGFAVVYGVVIVTMFLFALVLAQFTKGTNAVSLLGGRGEEVGQVGQVSRTRGESLLARLYGLSLMGGLVMFYLSVPFVVGGLLLVVGGLLYGILMLPRIPIKLLVLVVIIGLGMTWAVFKSLFTGAGAGGFGVAKDRDEQPDLHALVDEVAEKVDTTPIHEVYLAPGSEIGVHQEGRGPFGMFGVKKRVLTLGLASLQQLRVDELKAILAHEYAHFSHGDTFYSRFIHQVTTSIEQSLQGMSEAGGWLNCINPFYWFFFIYYKAYTMMAAGFSRSREFLADRMAAGLYGRDVFENGLTTVATHGTFFDSSVYHNVNHLLDSDQMFENVYQAYREIDEKGEKDPEREKLYEAVLLEEGSMFASHPTIRERIAAIAAFPTAVHSDDRPALSLVRDVEKVEVELTEFITAFVHHMRVAATRAEEDD